MTVLCVLPVYRGVSGPASFRARFTASLEEQGIRVGIDPLAEGCAGVLVIGGTKRMDLLWQARRKGVRIVQRLDGMNWIHRVRWTGVRHFLRAEMNNLILAGIRRTLADEIIYQSQYVIDCWDKVFGRVRAKSNLIYNGVDLDVFCPGEDVQPPEDRVRIACVEGRWRGGHEISLRNAIAVGEAIHTAQGRQVELVIAGEVESDAQKRWQASPGVTVRWMGVLPGEEIIRLNRSAHLFFSAEINAPCPNSVIEALGCGCPVIAFSTGSLPELVSGDAGRLAPYGSNLSSLGMPDVNRLAAAAQEILADQDRFRQAARARAEEAFDLQQVVERYLQVCLPG